MRETRTRTRRLRQHLATSREKAKDFDLQETLEVIVHVLDLLQRRVDELEREQQKQLDLL